MRVDVNPTDALDSSRRRPANHVRMGAAFRNALLPHTQWRCIPQRIPQRPTSPLWPSPQAGQGYGDEAAAVQDALQASLQASARGGRRRTCVRGPAGQPASWLGQRTHARGGARLAARCGVAGALAVPAAAPDADSASPVAHAPVPVPAPASCMGCCC